ncbi:uncharacterized protein LOC133817231 [Humulus lupulus]|uniref:uncharacterized protein LOC133817231 n=1 Tax=Humulus lupulus TaxID=3486 RepID=UPI002B416856|nr:uncharacterized protein LOC133817231 [Humulus lupulus]
MKYPTDVTTYQKSIERLRVHIFLAELDKSFDYLRREILRQTPRPILEECYAMVRREDLRSTTFNEENTKTEAFAMLSHWQPTNSKKSTVDKASLKCTHCNQTGHTKNRFFELIGYPDWWDPTGHRNARRPSTIAISQTKEDVGPSTSSTLTTTTEED